QDVAIQGDGALAERGTVDASAQAAPDQALDLHGAPALPAARRFALGALAGCARQHAVLGGEPAFTLAAQEGGDLFLDAGRAQHAGVAKRNQYRSFGMPGVATFEGDGAQLIGRAAAG